MISILINSLTEGGAEKVALTLLESYQKTGMEVELLCLEKNDFYQVPRGMRVHYLSEKPEPNSAILKLFIMMVAAWKLKKHVKRNKIKLVQSHLIRACYVNALSQIFGSRHKSQGVNHMIIGSNAKGKVNHYLIKFLYARLDEIISISEMMRRHWNHRFGFKNEHNVIPNPHNITDIEERAKEVPQNIDFHPEKRYMSFAGRLIPLKRVNEIIEVFAKVRELVPNLEFIVMGDGIERENLELLAQKLEVAPFIHFLGRVQNPYMYMKRSDLFVLNSETEGLPNVLIEAMACGTPIVSADCNSGPREILQPKSDPGKFLKEGVEEAEYGLLVPVANPDSLRKAILQMLFDDEVRNHYREQSLVRAANYDVDKITQEYVESFEDLIVAR
ncbi:MAG: glycosyltransferase [Bacteroidota bacterium]